MFYLICSTIFFFSFPIQSRAQITTDLLMELNEEVSGDFVEEVHQLAIFFYLKVVMIISR